MSGMTDTKSFGRIGVKGLLLFVGTTVVAAIFGLLFGNVLHVVQDLYERAWRYSVCAFWQVL